MENIDKLPKWAQQHIRLLEGRVTELKETIAKRNGEASEGRVILNPYGQDTCLKFPTRTMVRFALEGGSWRDYFEVSIKGDGIEVRAGGTLLIAPQVSNSIALRLAD